MINPPMLATDKPGSSNTPMEVIESDTEALQGASRFDVWSEAIVKAFGPIDVAPRRDSEFVARLRTIRRGPVRFHDIAYRGVTLHRSSGNVAKLPSEYFTLTRPLNGPLHVEHEHEMRVLQPGYLYLFNHAVPYRTLANPVYRTISVALPADALRRRLPELETFYALSLMNGDDATGASLMSTFADHLAFTADQGPEPEFATLTDQFLDLIALLISGRAGVSASSETSTVLAHRERARKYIRARLFDPELTPSGVAAGCGISLSYLKTVFRSTGRGIEEHIFAERLEQSRRALLDPLQSHLSISTIAYATGFNHPAHFSRAFKRRFGGSPTDVRKDSRLRHQ